MFSVSLWCCCFSEMFTYSRFWSVTFWIVGVTLKMWFCSFGSCVSSFLRLWAAVSFSCPDCTFTSTPGNAAQDSIALRVVIAEADPEQGSRAAACFRSVQEVALWSPSLTTASGLFSTEAKSKCTQKIKRAFPKQKPVCRLNAPLLTCSGCYFATTQRMKQNCTGGVTSQMHPGASRSALLAQDSCLLCKKELTAEKHMAVVYMYTSIHLDLGYRCSSLSRDPPSLLPGHLLHTLQASWEI